MRRPVTRQVASAPLSVGARWNYDQAPAGAVAPRLQSLDGPPGGSQPWIRRAMADQPGAQGIRRRRPLRFAQQLRGQRRARAGLEPAIGANITAKCYEGGHTMYEEPRVRSEMTRDVAAFLRQP